ncbi:MULTISPECIES: DUF961 family protein [unclassified Granulicatella]|uniref:DUF961 family protein n=1 Tax=unclassified Granulicatella TaxID=2630493 RepID=UPI001074905D|nr:MULTISPECIES: DUF961 family protein [unclassified Granulicatella]MBF0780675.1 DUF961 family protein [Granulicatella sp. 19428wC4_WM01]TFU94252.1 DUF961 domain-containing protein [Granulicatella sp. WM01]
MENTVKTPLDKFNRLRQERETIEKSKGTMRQTHELIDVRQLSREQERIMAGTFIDFENYKINYHKTFGKLVFLGFNSYRNYPQTHELAGEVKDYRYQIIDEVSGVDFIVNVSLEKQSDLLTIDIGQEVELINPKLEPFAILDVNSNRVNTGFSVTVDNVIPISQKAKQENTQVKQENTQVKQDNKA